MSAKTKCAICGKPVDAGTGTAPFCSPRCKMIDLGRWLGEDYKISEPLRPDHFLEMEDEEEQRHFRGEE